MSKKGQGQHQGASAHRGADSTPRETHQLGGDGEHVAEVQHAHADHAHAVTGKTAVDEIAKHRQAHFGMSPTAAKSGKLLKRGKPGKTSKHAKQ